MKFPIRLFNFRFLPKEKAKRNPLTFIPFGFGPRNCIGMRFAQMTMKLMLANILLDFKFVPCAETEVKIFFDHKNYYFSNFFFLFRLIHPNCKRQICWNRKIQLFYEWNVQVPRFWTTAKWTWQSSSREFSRTYYHVDISLSSISYNVFFCHA